MWERLLAVVGIAVCAGVVALVWLAGALYKAIRLPRAPIYTAAWACSSVSPSWPASASG